jgi:hypothetical protein
MSFFRDVTNLETMLFAPWKKEDPFSYYSSLIVYIPYGSVLLFSSAIGTVVSVLIREFYF